MEVGSTEKGDLGVIKAGLLGKGCAFEGGVAGVLRRFSSSRRGPGMALE